MCCASVVYYFAIDCAKISGMGFVLAARFWPRSRACINVFRPRLPVLLGLLLVLPPVGSCALNGRQALLVTLAAQNNNEENFKPVPYAQDEFPVFLRDVRRFEVILIGSVPLALLFSSLAYDVVYSINDPNIDSLTTAGSEQDILQKIGISVSISGLLAVIDMAIHLGKRHKERKSRERILRESEFIETRAPAESAKSPAKVGAKSQGDAAVQPRSAGASPQ